MRVLFRPVGSWPGLGQILQADGWSLQAGGAGDLVAEHPEVTDEEAARERLERLGLLTSGALHIEFLPDTGLRPG